ncbi:RICIN domain-containing protein [Streptomyces sp. So13.3]|uniref:RICIN domain-containing protein n=1 Tax=Streptomyces TaxID=1883 RepID=UPI00164E95D4|nr:MULTISPECIES: ricin-type beta-trefoil lectin domain protein [unclassified Streptomyces]MCZ4102208.1 ricin-type beta-trefoil lectin domain protein [Streptomyces sp. H39-C1]QNA70629.1 RICIN domain-containing protein [Streptomyces sp. So13.3]
MASLLTIVLALCGLSALSAAPASASVNSWGVVSNDWSVITDCMTPQGNGTSNGTKITTWDCTGSNLQQWGWDRNHLVHKVSGKCLTPSGNGSGTNGAVLTLWTCDYSYGSPQEFSSTTRHTFTLFGGKCITNYGGNMAEGTVLTLWSCAPDLPREQNWTGYYI